MRTGLLIALAAATCLGAEQAPATIVRLDIPDEGREVRPVALPTEPGNTLELEFPWPLEDWAGRGFTPDPERFAGDFVIEASRGGSRAFVTPVTPDAHRVLHVILAPPGAPTRSLTLEFIPSPSSLAWRKVSFRLPAAAREAAGPVTLSAEPARSPLRQPGPDAELGLLRTLRLMASAPADTARAVAAANAALQLAQFEPRPSSFGDFTLTPRFALRDSTTGLLGLCVGAANATDRRIALDPASWVVRVGDHVYPVQTVDFAPELEPGATGAAFLVLARRPDGDPLRLLADNTFEPSARLLGEVNPRPVRRFELDFLGSP